jgi:3-hydroxyisobutyrate dehydrogenase
MTPIAIKRVCFIGIGNMGWPMAARLINAGFEVTVTDALPGRAKDFVAQVGGTAVTDLAASARTSDVIVTMLPTSAHVIAVVEEIRTSLSAGKIFVDMSSGAPAATKKISEDWR